MAYTNRNFTWDFDALKRYHEKYVNKDRTSNSVQHHSIGRCHIKPNIQTINGVKKNILTQSMISEANTIYFIQYDFTLGEDITIPENCVLEFDGGSISNGTLIGNNTTIIGCKGCFALSVVLDGTFNTELALSDWFSLGPDCVLNEDNEYISGTDCTQGFKNMLKFRNIKISAGNYYCTNTLNIDSNTTIISDNAIIKFAYLGKYISSISIESKENISITGITFIGSKTESTESTEWNHGLYIVSSKNITLSYVNAILFRGDGICFGGNNDAYCSDIFIVNSSFNQNHRNNVSIINAIRIKFLNCTFNSVSGTAPEAGVDIEPNPNQPLAENVCKEISFENCDFVGNNKWALGLIANNGPVEHISLINCNLNGGASGGIEIRKANYIDIVNTKIYNANGNCIIIQVGITHFLTVRNCDIYCNTQTRSAIGIVASPGYYRNNFVFTNCKIVGGSYPISANDVDSLVLSNLVVTGSRYNIAIDNTCKNVIIGTVQDGNGNIVGYHTWAGQNYREVAMLSSLTGRSYKRAGTTAQRPTKFMLNGAAYYDTDLSKNIFHDSLKVLIDRNNKAPGEYYLENKCETGKEYYITFGAYAEEVNNHLYFSTTDDDSGETIEIIFEQEKTDLKSAIITAPDSSVYPYIKFVNGSVYWREINIYELNDGWIEYDGAVAGVARSGLKDNRPAAYNIYAGFQYFDTTLSKPIWWNGSNWVDSDGTTV